ncbi:KamA family radical SAM protein, partial [Mesorhizobium sp. M2E.F.Ca.ET.209.01.1.1]
RLSGICNPTYVIDLPDGGGKVPLAASHIEGCEGETWRIRGQDGKVREYREVVAGR